MKKKKILIIAAVFLTAVTGCGHTTSTEQDLSGAQLTEYGKYEIRTQDQCSVEYCDVNYTVERPNDNTMTVNGREIVDIVPEYTYYLEETFGRDNGWYIMELKEAEETGYVYISIFNSVDLLASGGEKYLWNSTDLYCEEGCDFFENFNRMCIYMKKESAQSDTGTFSIANDIVTIPFKNSACCYEMDFPVSVILEAAASASCETAPENQLGYKELSDCNGVVKKIFTEQEIQTIHFENIYFRNDTGIWNNDGVMVTTLNNTEQINICTIFPGKHQLSLDE